jgi:hypothetical protein
MLTKNQRLIDEVNGAVLGRTRPAMFVCWLCPRLAAGYEGVRHGNSNFAGENHSTKIFAIIKAHPRAV